MFQPTVIRLIQARPKLQVYIIHFNESRFVVWPKRKQTTEIITQEFRRKKSAEPTLFPIFDSD